MFCFFTKCDKTEDISECRLESQILDHFSFLEYLDLSGSFHNKSFGNKSQDCSANIISNPVSRKSYLDDSEAPINEILEVFNMKFKFPLIGNNTLDNISCKVQEIYLPSRSVDSIMFLGCAKWGILLKN